MLQATISEEVLSVRRYAGCLVGSNRDGDTLVAETLQRVLDRDVDIDWSAGSRLALFRALHDVWIVGEITSRALGGGMVRRHAEATARALGGDLGSRQIDLVLRLLSPIRRAVLILARMEGFSLDETAFVLRMHVGDVQRRLAEAELELDRVTGRRVLIVEDDVINGLDLEDLVMSLGHSAIGPAVTWREAVDLAMQEEPDLILSDIRLGDKPTGIDAVQEIRHRLNVPVIFVTGFPKYLADRVIMENSYVMAKPFTNRAMASCITNALWSDTHPQRRAI